MQWLFYFVKSTAVVGNIPFRVGHVVKVFFEIVSFIYVKTNLYF